MEPIYSSYNSLVPQKKEYPVYEIQSLEDREHLINISDFLVVEFYASWCSPCEKIIPEYGKLCMKYNKPSHGVYIVKENIEKNYGNISSKVSAVPCFQFWVSGEHVPELTIMGGNVENVDKTIFNVLQKLNK